MPKKVLVAIPNTTGFNTDRDARQAFLESLLEGEGYEVITSTFRPDALKMFKEMALVEQPDLVIFSGLIPIWRIAYELGAELSVMLMTQADLENSTVQEHHQMPADVLARVTRLLAPDSFPVRGPAQRVILGAIMERLEPS